MSLQENHGKFEREEAIGIIAKTIAEAIASTTIPENQLNKLDVLSLQGRIIEIAKILKPNAKLENFDDSLIALSIVDKAINELSDETFKEISGILRVILLYSNYKYLDFYKKLNTEKATPEVFLDLLSFRMDLSIDIGLGFNMTNLVSTCMIYAATSLTHYAYGDVAKAQMESGINTAISFLKIAEDFIKINTNSLEEHEIQKIISNSYSSFFLKLMFTQLNIFVAFNSILKMNKDGIFATMELYYCPKNKVRIRLKTEVEIKNILQQVLNELPDQSIQHWLQVIEDKFNIVGCPAYKFFQEITK